MDGRALLSHTTLPAFLPGALEWWHNNTHSRI